MVICSVASSKGGVGKTTLVANLGTLLSMPDNKVLLVDADLASGNLGLHLGLKNPDLTLHDILSAEDVSIESAIYEGLKGVSLLPSGSSLEGFLDAKVGELSRVIPRIAERFDVVLIDTPPGINRGSIIPLRASERVLLVTTPDPLSISAVLNTEKVLGLLEKKVLGIVMNRWRKRSFIRRLFGKETQVTPEEVESKLDKKILGVIPKDENVRRSAEVVEPVVIYKPKSPASKAFEKVASKIRRDLFQ